MPSGTGSRGGGKPSIDLFSCNNKIDPPKLANLVTYHHSKLKT